MTVAPVVALLLALLVYPLSRMVYDSLRQREPARRIDEYVGFSGFGDLLRDSDFWQVFRNSLLWTTTVVLGQFVLGAAAAYVVNRAFPGRWLVRIIVILPWAIPGVVAAMVWRLIYNPQIGTLQVLTGIIGWKPGDVLGRPSTVLWGVIVAAIWKGFSFWMLLVLAGLQSVPKDQIEAAHLDGAGAFALIRWVYVPAMAPVLRIGFILTAIWTFNYFEMVYVMSGGGGPLQSAHIFPTMIYEAAFPRLNPGEASRLAVLSLVVLSVLAVMFVREARRRHQL